MNTKVHIVEQDPIHVNEVVPGTLFMDFGRVAFGNLWLQPPRDMAGGIVVHFGESMVDGRVGRTPPGSVRYARVEVSLAAGAPILVAPPPDPRNTGHPSAVPTPAEWGVVIPFRWVEIEGWPGRMEAGQVKRCAAFLATWDDTASAFSCSDPMLSRIWDLCRYSIKATTFAGVYVDGDRERIAYEADAYINQVGHYYCDSDVHMARDTFDHLMRFPTWPTEWAFHMIFIAFAEWMQTGDTTWLAERYELLKPKLLEDRRRANGLLVSTPAQMEKGDLIDWPAGERDGFVFTPVNTVVNAFYIHSLGLMSQLAAALGRTVDAHVYASRAAEVTRVFHETLFDPALARYRDGEGTNHTSVHANLFPLAFGLVPEPHRDAITGWLVGRGMVCSVYTAMYLLEALFENGAEHAALDLIIAPGDRSWRHMIESGTTITWEAWDQRYKPNQDWSHAWGAAPAYLLPRYVLGVQFLLPGWSRVLVRPATGGLDWVEGVVPTPRGPISVRWENAPNFRMSLSLPTELNVRLELPAPTYSTGIWADGEAIECICNDGRWVIDRTIGGTSVYEVR
jgi:hypothetical protein